MSLVATPLSTATPPPRSLIERHFASLHQQILEGVNFEELSKADKIDMLGRLWLSWCDAMERHGSWKTSDYGTSIDVECAFLMGPYVGHIEEDGRVFDIGRFTSKWNIVTNMDYP